MSEFETEEFDENDVAVVGSAVHFPGARNVEEFWQNLRGGVESIRRLSDEDLRREGVSLEQLRNPDYVRAAAPIEDMEWFDAEFFNFSPRDASIMDPQHRHLLECAWETLESAGHPPEHFDGAIGVFAGCGMNAYMMYNIMTNQKLVDTVGMFLLRHTGNDKDFLSTRISYDLDLKGPSVNVQTACSTSLVAIHMACQSLLSGECDMALAGGVTIELPHRRGYVFQEGEILSPDGHCRAFDAESRGTVFGSGAGMVALRRLDDALADGDVIHAIVKGSAINNDGAGKVGYLAPSVDGQAAAISEALSVAQVDAESIDYVEAHGTGTAVGDPIEIAALSQAFGASTDRKQYCGIGSVKTNIGHLDTAAGIANFVKVVESLRNKELPPSLHYENPNPVCEFENTPFYVNDTLQEWKASDTPRRAGISSLGVGGTNAHVVVEEAPERPASTSPTREIQILPISARTESALEAGAARLADHLHRHPDLPLADVAHTLQSGRRAFSERTIFACRDTDEAIALLEQASKGARVRHTANDSASVVFMFPGGGAQYPRMGQRLYVAEPVFREHVDRGLALLTSLVDYDPKTLFFSSPGEDDATAQMLDRPSVQLPLVMIIEYALAQTWRSLGVEPSALIGHSMGENAAACVADVLSFEDCVRLVVLRGRLFESVPEGGMLSIAASADDVRTYLPEDLDLATVNAPELCVVSGPSASLEALSRRLGEDGVQSQRVGIAIAAHSRMLDPILAEFGEFLKSIDLRPPQIPIMSNHTGDWLTPEQATSASYWVDHLRNTILFSEGIGRLAESEERIFLEVGPGKTLGSLAKQHHSVSQPRNVFGSMRHADEDQDDGLFFATSVGRLWAAGYPFDWAHLHGTDRRLRVPLPTYAFQRERHWISPGIRESMAPPDETAPERLELDEWFSQIEWTRATPIASAGGAAMPPTSWLIFAESLAGEYADRLAQAGHRVVTVQAGPGFDRRSDSAFVIDAASPEDYERLFQSLSSDDFRPTQVVHAWSITGGGSEPDTEECLQRGFYSLFHLAGAQARSGWLDGATLTVLSDGLVAIEDQRPTRAAKAALLGPVRVLPHEMPEVGTRSWDLPHEIPLAERESVHALLDSLFADEVAPKIAAIRNGSVWTPQRSSLRLAAEATPSPGVAFRDEGTYVLTGGLGGVGLSIARYLARRHRAKLLLLGRSPVPAREDWDRVLADPDRGEEAQRVRSLLQLESAGAKALALSVDVTDPESIGKALSVADEEFGGVDGVLHCAGVLDDAPIALKDRASVDRVLAAKIHGTLALDQALGDRPLDFLALFSSTSAQLGLAGQVDYTAANAFLDAFAEDRVARGRGYTVSIEWGTWRDVGMAAETARSMGLVAEALPETGEPVAHPLLGERFSAGMDVHHFVQELDVREAWVLDEHRIREFGPLLPGTGYIELMRAAWTEAIGATPLRVEALTFIAPLRADESKPPRIRTLLERDGDAFRCVVMSQQGRDDTGRELWTDHAEAHLRNEAEAPPARVSLKELRARCDGDEILSSDGEIRTRQEDHLDFGPRWKNLEWMRFGRDEALASLALPPAFAGDLETYSLHPALLDIATGFGLPLIEGYQDCDDLYVPMTYGSIRIHASLPTRFFSHLKRRSSAGATDVVTFDATLFDGQGQILVEIEGFSMRRIAEQASLDEREPSSHPLTSAPASERKSASGPLSLLQIGVEQGIQPDEGAEALRRILAHGAGPVVAVSSLDLGWLREQADPTPPTLQRTPTAGVEHTKAVAYLDAVEAKVAAIWSDLLGTDEIARDEEFFDVGGHSLLGIRVVNKINAEFGTGLEPAMLFESPTIALLAELIREQKPELATEPGAGGAERAGNLEGKQTMVEPSTEPDETAASNVAHANLAAIAAVAPPRPPRHRATESGRPYAMREHWFARLVLAPLFSIRRQRLRDLLEWLILKLEGGEWFSVTLRRLYADHFDMEIGDYTGSCFDRGQFKPGTRIGRYCSIFPSARIETANHPSNTISTNGLFYQPGAGFSKGFAIPRNRVEIGNDVHIGHNATILYPARKIGDGAIIGTGAIVDFDVPPYAIVAGTPAAIIRYRFPKERIEELLASNWWNATLEEIEDLREEFVLPLEGKSVR